MRYQIGQESVEIVPGQFWLNGAIKWDDKPISVTGFNQSFEVIGKATNICREKDHKITAEITFLNDVDALRFVPTVECSKVKWHIFKKTMFIETATIRNICMTISIPWAFGYTDYLTEASTYKYEA